MINKDLRANCPVCDTSYPIATLNLYPDSVSADIVCSTCHSHFVMVIEKFAGITILGKQITKDKVVARTYSR